MNTKPDPDSILGLTHALGHALKALDPKPRTRGKYQTECSVRALGVKFDARVTYDFTPGTKDEPATMELWTVALIGCVLDGFDPPIAIDMDELPYESIEAIEHACFEAQQGDDSAYDAWKEKDL